MAKLKNVGAYPNTEDALGRTDHMNDLFAQRAVTTSQVTAAMDTAKSPLAQKTYIDEQDALYTTKTYVDQQDALLINSSTLGASGGVAKLDASAKVAGVSTARTAGVLPYMWQVNRTDFDISVAKTSAIAAATFSITSPGFSWFPLFWGWSYACRASGGTDDGSAFAGIEIRDSGGYVVSRGFGTSRAIGDWYPVSVVPTPGGASSSSTPKVYTGAQTFTLYHFRAYGTSNVNVGSSIAAYSAWVVPASSTATTPSWV